jgi:hypothetical protein
MVDPVELAGDVVTGATALAGLVLVYLGMAVSGFAGFERDQQASVRARFQVRAWFAFVGMAFSILAAILALIGKWSHNACIAGAAFQAAR